MVSVYPFEVQGEGGLQRSLQNLGVFFLIIFGGRPFVLHIFAPPTTVLVRPQTCAILHCGGKPSFAN